MFGWFAGCVAGSTGEAPVEAPAPLPIEALQAIADRLVVDAGVPGALLAVQRGDERWLGAAGTEDLAGTTPMPADGTFRAASLTKLFTGALVLRQVDAGSWALDAPLAAWAPTFPGADGITVDQLLSHTAGVTATWLDDPTLQGIVLADLGRVWTPDEVLAQMATAEPAGSPGRAMVYSNTGFVLLGEGVADHAGAPFPDALQGELLGPLGLDHTAYTFDTPDALIPGYTEFGGAVLDITLLPQAAVLSFAGSAGALHTTTADLLTYADALFRQGAVVSDAGLATMMTPAAPDAWYGHATMRFCPCPDGPTAYTGWGHGGNLPGYWSVTARRQRERRATAPGRQPLEWIAWSDRPPRTSGCGAGIRPPGSCRCGRSRRARRSSGGGSGARSCARTSGSARGSWPSGPSRSRGSRGSRSSRSTATAPCGSGSKPTRSRR